MAVTSKQPNIVNIYFQFTLFGLCVFCLCGVIITIIIFFKLLWIFKDTQFINKMFTVLFCSNSLASLLTFKCLFEIAYLNLTSKVRSSYEPPDHLLSLCTSFILTLYSSQVILVVGNAGILFCRFIYIRHARGLIKEGKRLFHWLVIVLVTCFSLQLLFFYPLLGFIKYYDVYPLNMARVRISRFLSWGLEVPMHNTLYQSVGLQGICQSIL